MKKLCTLFAVAVCILTSTLFAGCGGVSLPPAYRTETTVAPLAAAHQYIVQFRIIEVAKDGKTNVLSSPRMVVEAGQEAQVTIGEERGRNGIFCTAIVREIAAGIEALAAVTIKKDGIEKLNTSQIMTVQK